MTDPTPLINPQPPLEYSNSSSDPKTSTSTLDETIERCLGNFGRKQFIQVFLVSLSWIFDGQQTFITIFTDADPTWHCNNADNTTTTSSTRSGYCNNFTRNGGFEYLCLLPKDDDGASWSWDLPPYASTISEWSLQCAGSFLNGLPASSFFAGCLAGGFLLATLADSKLGRKKLLALTCLLMSLSGILTAASANVWMYAVLRFLSGFCRATVGTSALVLATELVGKKWRGQVGIMGFFFFTFGFLSLPLLGYLNRGSSWRLLYIWTCVPAAFYSIILHLFVCESPRWLYVQGRRKEFFQTLRRIGNLPVSEEEEVEDLSSTITTNGGFFFSAMKTLWEEGWAFRRLSTVMVIGFGEGLVYYGMPLGLQSLKFNLYLSVALNALSELPAALITFFLVGNLNRKAMVMGFSLLSGICSLICAFFMVNGEENNPWSKGLRVGSEVAAFFSACTAFNVLLIYTLELFPTCVRNSALSMVRQSVVFGGVFGPVAVVAGKNNGLYSYGIFGFTIAVSGLFVGSLPETRGSSICDTLEEEKQKEFRSTSAAAAAKNISINVNVECT